MALFPRLRIATGTISSPLPPLPTPPSFSPTAPWHPSQLRWLYASPISQRKSRKPVAAQSSEESLAQPGPVVLEDDIHSIRDRHISRPAWAVLQRLRSAGHEAFLVGGTVRDILLRRIPKDFDVLTSAEAYQVASLFPRAILIGRKFPICHVYQDGIIIEVSSFSTSAEPGSVPMDAAARTAGRGGGPPERRRTRDRKERRKKSKAVAAGEGGEGSVTSESSDERDGSSPSSFTTLLVEREDSSIESFSKNSWEGSRWVEDGITWASARRENAIKRDFTVNGLLYDPFSRTLYDYVGGVRDCEARSLRALGPPEKSFIEDPARVLRGIRLAARTGLIIDDATSDAIVSKSHLVSKLSHGRLQMELGAMMSQGAARESLELLWKYRLLETLLPHHAVLFSREKVPRDSSTSNKGATPLLYRLASLLDDQTQAHQPADTSVWVALLLAPLVAAECHTAAKRRAASAKRRRLKAAAVAAAAAAGGGGALSPSEGDTNSNSSAKIINNGTAVLDVALAVASSPSSSSSSSQDEEFIDIDYFGKESGEKRAWDAPTQEYLEVYNRAVDSAVSRLFSSLDAKAQRALATSSGSKKTSKFEEDGDQAGALIDEASGLAVDHDGSEDTSVVVASQRSTGKIPACLLPRQALESAAETLKMEAALRGEPLPEPSAAEGKGGRRGGERRRGRRQRRLAQNDIFVLQLLRRRDVGWAALTDVGV